MRGLEKNSMDVIDVYVAARLYNDRLKDCYLDNFYRVQFYWLAKVRCREGVVNIKLEPGVRFHLSNIVPSEKKVDPLAIFVRKHLDNVKVLGVRQVGWERVLRVELARGSEKYSMFIELLPRGVVVIANYEERILFASKQMELRDRVVKRGVKYQPPPARGLPPYSERLVEVLLEHDTLVKGLTRGWGLPGYVAEELAFRSGLFESKNTKPANIAHKDLENLTESYNEVVKEAENGNGFLVYATSNEPLLYTSFKPSVLIEEYKLSVKGVDFNTAVDTFFGHYERRVARETTLRRAGEKAAELKKAIDEIQQRISAFQKDLDGYRSILNTIYENYAQVEQVLLCAQEVRRAAGWESVPERCSGVESYQADKGLVLVKVGDSTVWLDIRLDLKRNVIEIKKKIGELERKLETALNKKREMEEELKQIGEASLEEPRLVIRPREWYERFHWTITSNGFLAIGGRDADQNETIYRKYMEESDIFLHADVHGAPVVVVKTRGEDVPETDIREAAYLTACYSRAWKAGLASIEVFWVRGGQVSKSPPSGEYLSKGSFMVYGKRNYLSIPLELALGVEKVESSVYGVYYRLFAGPEDLVKRRTVSYVVLRPSNQPVETVAREVYGSIVRGLASEFISVNDIIERLPGPSVVVKTVKIGG
ncbi:ribosome rescue protein RqcH [Thermogladius calderae]|nr:ribosome rescue protein RqcH [Thermogladius calderae]